MNYKNVGKKLAEMLKNDNEFYYAYQANIAMTFYDEFRRCTKKHKNLGDIYKISNQAAKNFLNLFCKEN